MSSVLLPRSSRGVLFTFLTFLFIGVLLSLVVFRLNVDQRNAQTSVEVSVLNAINAKYDDITDDIITLDHPIGIPSITQRILPFTYQVDSNTLHVRQSLPIASGKLNLYYDLLNAYSIFVQDQNTQRTYDGTAVQLNVPKPPTWGGNSVGAGFNLLPSCTQYHVHDSNNVSLDGNNSLGCENTFDIVSSIRRIDVNVSLPTSSDDYDTLSCDFDGNTDCPYESFDSNAGPYFTLRFLDANCTNCSLMPMDKNLFLHFNLTRAGTLTYSCSGGGGPCVSSPLRVFLGNDVRFTHGGTPMIVDLDILFTQTIRTFYYQDANYSVHKSGFTTYKSNVVVFPQ